MMDVALSAVANQSLSVTLDQRQFDITVREVNGCMAATIARDGVTLVSGLRLVAGAPLLPYQYQEDGAGNFLLTVDNEALPYWDQFGVTQFLVYVTAAEIAAFRAA